MIRVGILLLPLLSLSTGGCGGEGGSGAGREGPVRDGGWEAPVEGERMEEDPHRVVSLIPAATGIVVALGAGGTRVGVGQGDPSPAARDVASVGSILAPSQEGIVALAPTLVVVWNAVDAGALRRALPEGVVLLREGMETLEDLERVTLHLGGFLGRSAQAEALVAGLRGGGTGLAPCTDSGARGPTAAWIVSVDPIVVAGPSSWPGRILAAAGALPVPEGVPGAWPTLSPEVLATLAPEIMVLAGLGEDTTPAAALRRLLPSAAFVPVDGDRFHVPTLEFAARVAELEALLAPVAPTPLCTDPAPMTLR